MSFQWYYFTWLCLMVGLGVKLTNAQVYRRFQNRLLPYRSITVDPRGHGRFNTIQSAIDSVPSNNRYWTSIHIKAGTYREKLTIPNDKSYIIIEGEGISNTFVEWDDHATTAQSPTFFIMANNIVVKCISFKNTYNDDPRNRNIVPAVATMVSGDMVYFYQVGFYGFQDTLWDDQGRHYFKQCTIQGGVDFIFGAGQSLYEDSTILVNAARLGEGISGIITAQGRTNPNDANGFVFKNCNVYGDGTAYLGRPWRDYARVLFYNSTMSNIIEPCGWIPWNSAGGHEAGVVYAEYHNYGPGSDTSKRVDWMKHLNGQTLNTMASIGFVDSDGWLKDQQKF